MKTSLMIEDSLYAAAKAEALKTGKSLSEVITAWARCGRQKLAQEPKAYRKKLATVDLGSPAQVDLSSRSSCIEML